jgi:stress response protein YsnF
MTRTIIAIYDELTDSAQLRRDLEAVGAAGDRVQISSDNDRRTDTATAEREPRGFFDWLFGVPENEVSSYREHIEGGRTIVTVLAPEVEAPQVVAVLEGYGPIDVDVDRESARAEGVAAAGGVAMQSRAGAAERTQEAIPVVEEDVKVGKREVERGRVRVRSYVVERPIEELVRLRDETVRVERRPASGDAPVSDDAFKERSIEVSERDEEPVVEKRARVKEEVLVSKDVGERTEQVRDKARRTKVEVEKEGEIEHAGPEPRGRK